MSLFSSSSLSDASPNSCPYCASICCSSFSSSDIAAQLCSLYSSANLSGGTRNSQIRHRITYVWDSVFCVFMAYLAWLSFCFRLISSIFLAFSAFCSSTSFLWACTRRSRLRTKATSCLTSSLRSLRAFSLVFLFSFSMALFSQRLEACRESYSSFHAKFLRVQKLCQ